MILAEYLVDHCWVVRCDHHVDGLIAYRTWADDRGSAINNTDEWHGHASAANCLWCKPPKTNCPKTFWPLLANPERYRHQKWRNPRTGQSSTDVTSHLHSHSPSSDSVSRLSSPLVPTRTSWYDLLIIVDYYHCFSFFSGISRGLCNNWDYSGHVKHVDDDDDDVQIFRPIGARYLSLGKIHIFPIGDSPGGLSSHAIHFWKALVEPMLPPCS